MPRAIQFQRYGDADVLEIIDRQLPAPAPGEVLVAVDVIGVNWVDMLWRRNMGSTEAKLPAGLGTEMAGTVIEVGADVTRVAPGDRVASIPAFDPNRYATYAERTLLPEAALIRYPDRLSPAEACVHYMPSLVSWLGLREVADLQPDETVLITSACHIGGPYAIQVARALGAKVIAATRYESGIEYLKSLGAHAVIHTESQDVVSRINKLTDDHGIDVALDVLGGRQLNLLGEVMATRGRLILYGMLGGNDTSFPAQAAFRKNIQFFVHCLSNFSGKPQNGIPQNREALDRAIADIDRMTRDGLIRPQIDRRFAFEEIVEAHRYLETCANHQGRIVVEVS
ncbi:zinc-dependent alcohol dehydrogenase family protein [Salinicola avicenniae]|uniref:zinc-dependent alcohol dehydrogenase family protein n=1 Tax=Salinicola avicenniae TaxID=2916836 RepID=UPI002073B647|nr:MULTISPECIES: zinc-dependent alcohol dehydrogenase family protein [unclassified Salinicola]